MLKQGRVIVMKPRVRDEAPDTEALAAVQVALERKPDVTLPADFAQRVAARASTLPQRRKSGPAPYARVTALVVSVVFALGLFVLAPRTSADFRNFGFDLELLVLLQLGVLAWWMGRQPNPNR